MSTTSLLQVGGLTLSPRGEKMSRQSSKTSTLSSTTTVGSRLRRNSESALTSGSFRRKLSPRDDPILCANFDGNNMERRRSSKEKLDTERLKRFSQALRMPGYDAG